MIVKKQKVVIIFISVIVVSAVLFGIAMGVKKYREDKKLTQTYIADVLKVKSATVSKYESNQIFEKWRQS